VLHHDAMDKLAVIIRREESLLFGAMEAGS
jgi:hypothetical protein